MDKETPLEKVELTLSRTAALFEKAQAVNHYLYFELAFTHTTEWMCWLVDKSKKANTDKHERPSSEGFVVLAEGQSDDVKEACQPVLAALEKMGYTL